MLGQVIHGYRIDRALSADKGGFGDVFFATHVESGAEAVVKVLKPEMSAMRDIVARFFNEARAAASVHHPGIVQIHNMGYHGDRAYLLMERLRGDDLETRLAAGPLALDRALVFMRQAAGAVGAAHDRGIVHRDLKPANLFVVSDPDVVGGERIKVLDFGIAKLTADSGAGKTQGVFGTPAYMSPEQCASTSAVDGRADLYSLGCIFYELVSGRPPFGHGGIELVAAHLRDTPLPPRQVAPWLPPAVEQVILGLLEKQPDRRIASCAALVAAIDHAAATAGVANMATGGAGASLPRIVMGGRGGPGGASGMVAATTLGGAAGVAATQPARKSGKGLWLGLGAVVIVGGAIAVIAATGALGGHAVPAGGGAPPAPPSIADARLAQAASVDAAPIAVVPPPDAAAVVASAPPDATSVVLAPPPNTPPAAVAPPPRTPHVPAGASMAEVASALNEQGKKAMYDDHYLDAARLFREAIARVAEPKYFFNLAVAQVNAGDCTGAQATLRAVIANNPSPELAAKVERFKPRVAELIQGGCH